MQNGAYQSPRMIISVKDIDKITIKRLPDAEIHTHIFTYLNHHDLCLNEKQIDYFKKQGYSMDDWLQGKPLVVNDKYPDEYRYKLLKLNKHD